MQTNLQNSSVTVMPSLAASKTMLNEKELSDRIGIPAGTLANWRVRRKAGEKIGPPFVKVGGKPRYRITDLEAWEANLPIDGEDGEDGEAA